MMYRFDPQLSRASTIPSSYYNDASVIGEENRMIFSKTWQLVGHDDQLREGGQFFTTSVAGEPLLIVRGDGSRHRDTPDRNLSARRLDEPHAASRRCYHHLWPPSQARRIVACGPKAPGRGDLTAGPEAWRNVPLEDAGLGPAWAGEYAPGRPSASHEEARHGPTRPATADR